LLLNHSYITISYAIVSTDTTSLVDIRVTNAAICTVVGRHQYQHQYQYQYQHQHQHQLLNELKIE